MIIGCFSFDDDNKSVFKNDDIITKDIVKNNDKRKYPVYFGEELNTGSRIGEFREFIINKKLKSWTMSDRLYKCAPNYTFRVFMFEETSNVGEYKCIHSIKSPPFQIMSARRIKPIIERDNNNNNNINEIDTLFNKENLIETPPPPPPPYPSISEDLRSNNFSDSELRKIIKEMREKSSFKYKNIMPHVYEEEEDKYNNQNEYQRMWKNHLQNANMNKTIVEKNAFTFEDMKYTFQDIINSNRPNTIYKINSWFEMELVLPKDDEADKTNEELTSIGGSIHIDLTPEKGFEYLDKYGNRYKFISSREVIKL